MPLLYALPITLAVVGTIAVTLLVVEVIVPALLQDPHQHHDRARRGRRRRQRPVLVQASTREEGGIVSTGVAARSEDYGYEIRKRRPQPQQHRQADEELHVLGEVTASEYELAGDVDSSLNLAPVPPGPSGSPPPYPSSAAAAARGETTEEQRPLLLFEEGEEELAASGDGEKLDPCLLEQDGTTAIAEPSTAAVHPDLLSEAVLKPVVDDLEAAASSFSSRGEDTPPVHLDRDPTTAASSKSNPEVATSSSSSPSPVVSVSVGLPSAAIRHCHRERDHEQSSSYSTAPPPTADGTENTKSSDTTDSFDGFHASNATAAADGMHRHPLAETSFPSSTAAAATITRPSTPSDLTCATSSAFVTAAQSPTTAADAPSSSWMVAPETGSETGFSSPELLSMSRSTSQSGSVVSAGEEAARSDTGEEKGEEEDGSSSWTRVSSPCGFTSLSSDDDDDHDDVGEIFAQAA